MVVVGKRERESVHPPRAQALDEVLPRALTLALRADFVATVQWLQVPLRVRNFSARMLMWCARTQARAAASAPWAPAAPEALELEALTRVVWALACAGGGPARLDCGGGAHSPPPPPRGSAWEDLEASDFGADYGSAEPVVTAALARLGRPPRAAARAGCTCGAVAAAAAAAPPRGGGGVPDWPPPPLQTPPAAFGDLLREAFSALHLVCVPRPAARRYTRFSRGRPRVVGCVCVCVCTYARSMPLSRMPAPLYYRACRCARFRAAARGDVHF